MDKILNETTTTIGEQITHFLDQPEEKAIRRLVYDITQAVVGFFIVGFNGFVIVCYIVSRRTGKVRFSTRFNFGLLALILFCFIHGIVFSVVYTIQRNYRKTMSIELCVITTLLLDYCDHFISILLPLNAIDRLIQLKYPTTSRRKHRNIMISLLAVTMIITALVAWIPMIPGADVVHQNYYTINAITVEKVKEFASAYTCGGMLNKKMKSAPYIHLGAQLACAILVVSLHVTIHGHTKVYQAVPQANNRESLKKMGIVSRSALAMSIIVILTNIPYSTSEVIRTNCKYIYADGIQAYNCSVWLLEMKIVLKILFHFGNLLAPLVYTMLDYRIRRGIKYYMTTCHCVKRERREQNSKDNAIKDRQEMNSFLTSRERVLDIEMYHQQIIAESV